MNQFKWIDSELDLLIWMLTWIECKWTDSKMYLIIYQIFTDFTLLLNLTGYDGCLVDSFNRKEQKIRENAFYYIVQSYGACELKV